MINLDNTAFKTRVGGLVGGIGFLKALGYKKNVSENVLFLPPTYSHMRIHTCVAGGWEHAGVVGGSPRHGTSCAGPAKVGCCFVITARSCSRQSASFLPIFRRLHRHGHLGDGRLAPCWGTCGVIIVVLLGAVG